ncbi:serine-rich adhesin for platelets isoform X2 [Bombus terrestris]|uniref:Serine-rich adhesin for platelets isoform X2 n=1 Tax=Bombus terrestris TaxID=30195 RepID=A0A9B0CF77_BOMTE|nr:serine-rich adhesin for platelets isoform X2 [Bombus terrestris]
MGAWMSWLILLQLSSVFVHGYDNVGFDGWYQPVPHRPVDIITDVINDLGVRILQQYTAHGNVAFSPTGVGFILAALYEGSAGRGRQQIADALGLPRDRDITRIGFRDIHRRLRTYLNADGFLGGLTLNHENTKLRPEYEDILRFYGFDLSIPEEETNETETTSVPETTSAMTEQSTTEARTLVPDETTTPSTTIRTMQSSEITSDIPMSTTPMVELIGMTLSTIDEQDRLTQTISDSSVLTGATVATTLPSLVTTLSTEAMTTSTSTLLSSITTSSETSTTVISTTTTTAATTTTSEIPQTTVTNSAQPITTVTSTPSIQSPNADGTSSTPSTLTSTVAIISTPSSTSAVTFSTSMETNLESTIISAIGQTTVSTDQATESVMTTEPITESTTALTGSTPSSTSTTTGTTVIALSAETSETSAANVTEASTSSTIPTQANEASSTNGPPADENTVSTGSNNQSIPNEMGSTDLPVTTTSETGSTGQLTTESSSTMMNRRKRSDRSPRGFFSSYPDEGIWMQDLGIWKPYSTTLNEASVRDSTEISFLVNGCDVSSVTASRYFAVLPFAYFPSLHAVALEFPLDDPRYNILLMMATDRRDTYRLARDLGGKSLRLLRKQLQATWVRATIPSFMLRGFVTLTSFLQRLGILDVFEPRTADLSPMTPDLGVYARDVQQSIGVNIRNYMKPDRTHSRNGLFERAGPVPFTVVHPFLYFIVDAETSVALIAGRVNDPLNSRIL